MPRERRVEAESLSDMNPYGNAAAVSAATIISRKYSDLSGQPWQTPVAGVVLGSGFASVGAEAVRNAISIPFRDIPGLPAPTVEGHVGEILIGDVAGKRVVVFSGRLHLYEGHSPAQVTFHARVLRALGVPVYLVFGAAGGLNSAFAAGSLMLVSDHINLTGRNPLIGALEPGDERFPDMYAAYDPGLRTLLHACARSTGIGLGEGVYAGLTGPSYETPAELRMLRVLGADAVGMSTVLEVIAARAVGLRVAVVVTITNEAAGGVGVGEDAVAEPGADSGADSGATRHADVASAPLLHSDVVAAARRASAKVGVLLWEFIERIQ